jgi:hypothetical protein
MMNIRNGFEGTSEPHIGIRLSWIIIKGQLPRSGITKFYGGAGGNLCTHRLWFWLFDWWQNVLPKAVCEQFRSTEVRLENALNPDYRSMPILMRVIGSSIKSNL